MVLVADFRVVREFFLFVRQRSVGFRHELELSRLARIVAVHVGVEPQRQLAVRGFDLVDRRRVWDAQNLVKILGRRCSAVGHGDEEKKDGGE